MNTIKLMASVAFPLCLLACGGVETTTISAGPLMYNKLASFKVEGPNLDRGITFVAPLCSGIKMEADGTESMRTFSCTPNTVGDMPVSVTGGGVLLHSSIFSVPVPRVAMKTNLGEVVMELDPKKAPLSVKNFLQYVSDGFYANLIFHRVIPNFVIQAGGFDAALVLRETRAAIKLEASNGLSNLRGSVAMARSNALNSATSQFYINVVDNVSLDTLNGGYAVFGQVVTGLTTVDAIAAVPTAVNQSMADVPVNAVTIESMVQIQ